jgi:hypothetical protein
METRVLTKKGTDVMVYTEGGKIKFCLYSNYNPDILNSRLPTFNGTFKEAIEYIEHNY